MLRFPLRQHFEDLRDHLTEAQWDMLRIAGVLIVVGLLAAGVYWIGEPRWRRWQNHQALAQASHFAVERDYRSMILALRRATELEPGDRATWEEAARELGGISSPEELVAREQIVRLAPDDTQSRLDLAREALRFGRYDSAREALDGLPSGAPRDLAYQRVAVAVAIADNNTAEALRQLQRLIALDPRDTNARFTAAAMRLWSSDPAEKEAARRDLGELLSDPATRLRAAIELITDGASSARGSRGDPAAFQRLLLHLAGVFVAQPGLPPLRNTLQLFDVLVEGMKQAAKTPSDAALMARWLVQLNEPRDAVAWLDGRPPPLGDTPLVAETVAQLAAETGNDEVLQRRLKAGAWGDWPEDVWEKAIAARRAGKPANDPAWAAAIAACGDSLDALRNLGRLASAWHEWAVADAAWLAILDRDPGIDWAYQTLRSDYIARGDEAGLFSLYSRRALNRPDDAHAAADWVTLACLLDRTSAAVYQRADLLGKGSPDALIAEAAALWRRDEPVEASKTLDQLQDDERAKPAAAFWNAIIKSDLPDRDAARAAIARALATPRLPAERTLLAAAEAKAGYVAVSPRPKY